MTLAIVDPIPPGVEPPRPMVIIEGGENTAEATRQAGLAAEDRAAAEEARTGAEEAAAQAQAAVPYYATVAAGAAATAAPLTFLSDEDGPLTLYDDAGNALYEIVSGSRVLTLEQGEERTWLNANKRSEPYAAGWLAVTTREEYTYSKTDAEQQVGEYHTSLRGASYPVDVFEGGDYPRYNFRWPHPHELHVGDRVVISDGSDAGYDGTRPVYAVVDDLTIQIDYLGAGPAGTGTALASAYGTIVNAADPVLRYSFPREGLRRNALGAAWVRHGSLIDGPELSYGLGGARYFCEFMLDDDQLEVITVDGAPFDIWLDGCLLQNGDALEPFVYAAGDNYPLNYHKFVFERRKVRQVRLLMRSYLAGVAGRRPSSIQPLSGPRRPRAVALGASYEEGTGAPSYKFGYLALLCARQGWDLCNLAAGGTGIGTDGGGASGKKKFIDRLYEVAKHDPDVLLIPNTINGTTTRADCDELLEGARIVAPNAKIYGLGVPSPVASPDAGYLTADQDFRAACEAAGVTYLDGGIGAHGLPNWVTAGNLSTYYNGTQATATTTLTADAVTSATVTAEGEGYDFFNTPDAVLSGGGGTGAALTPVWNAEVTAIQVLDGGFGYSVAPDVVIECGATAVVSRDGGSTVAAVAVTDGGGGYITAPEVSFSGGGGTGAAADAVIEDGRVVRIDVTNVGSGYTSDPTVTIAESTTQATGTATIAGGKVTGITITDPGSFYTSIPRITLVPDASGGQGALAVAHISCKLDSLTVAAGGSGYSGAPTVAIAHPTAGDTAHPKTIGHMMLAERYGYQLEQRQLVA